MLKTKRKHYFVLVNGLKMQERDPRPHGCGHGEGPFFAVRQM